MYELVWIKDGDTFLREEIDHKSLADAVADTRARAGQMSDQLQGSEPDSFRLIDLGSATSALYSLEDDA